MNAVGTTFRARVGLAGRVAALASVCVVGAVMSAHAPSALAATNAGSVQILQPPAGQALTSGGSSTAFAMTPPAGAACTGDSIAGYRVQTFMVRSTVDVSTLTFNASGPITPAGTVPAFLPMYSTTGTPFVNKTTGAGTGALSGLPAYAFNFDPSVASFLPPGTYKIGYACTLGPAGPTQLDKYWSTTITIVASGTDPLGLTWTTATVTPPTTTTLAPTTTLATTTTAAATTTTVRPTTTTTAAATTTTVPSGGTTTTSTTTTVSATTTTLTDSGSVTTTTEYTGGGLVSTGGNVLPKVLWGLLLLVIGRMVLVAARPIRVRESDR